MTALKPDTQAICPKCKGKAIYKSGIGYVCTRCNGKCGSVIVTEKEVDDEKT